MAATQPLPMLRRLRPSDVEVALEVYRDAVITQATALYSTQQIEAWAGHAAHDPGVRAAMVRGHGLVSHAACSERIEGFALLDPPCRLSLLYCRGSASRQGHGRALVKALEAHAQARGCRQLRTEASRLSRPLLERLDWRVEAEERVLFAGVHFSRWRMIRNLT